MATLQKKKGNRLSRFFSIHDLKDPKAVTGERRAVSHNPQTTSQLPERPATAKNTSWLPPPQHARAASAQISKHQLLSPLGPPADIHMRPVGGSESSASLQISSATSSPANSRPPSGHSSHPNSPYRTTLAPPHAPHAQIPDGDSPGVSPTRLNKKKSWFAGSEKKLTKPGKEAKEEKPAAWIVGIEGQKPTYDLRPLLDAQQVGFYIATICIH
jgi:hypothetical protein